MHVLPQTQKRQTAQNLAEADPTTTQTPETQKIVLGQFAKTVFCEIPISSSMPFFLVSPLSPVMHEGPRQSFHGPEGLKGSLPCLLPQECLVHSASHTPKGPISTPGSDTNVVSEMKTPEDPFRDRV